MTDIIGETFNKMASQLMTLAISGVLAYVVIYFIVNKLSNSSDFAKLSGGVAMLAAFYFTWKSIFL